MKINTFGLIFVAIMLIPNIIFAIKNKDEFSNLWHNKFVEILEQIGRFGCIVFMIVILPYFKFGFASDEKFAIYFITNSMLVMIYCIVWAVCYKKNSIFRALTLSIIPSIVFILSAVLSNYLPLLVFALIFAPCHILISYKNAVS